MEIREITNKEIWENFLLGCDEKTFLQSWNWGEFNKIMGNKIWRFGVSEMSNLIGLALVIKIKARRGTFLFVPHGPVIKIQNSIRQLADKSQILEIFLEELKKIAKEQNCSFIRIAPVWKRIEENKKIFQDLDFRQAPIHMHPEVTWELDLTPSEDEILMKGGMRKTTRYLIR